MKSRVRLPGTGIKSSTQTEANVFIVLPHSLPAFHLLLLLLVSLSHSAALAVFEFCIRRRSLLVFRLQLILDLLMRRFVATLAQLSRPESNHFVVLRN